MSKVNFPPITSVIINNNNAALKATSLQANSASDVTNLNIGTQPHKSVLLAMQDMFGIKTSMSVTAAQSPDKSLEENVFVPMVEPGLVQNVFVL